MTGRDLMLYILANGLENEEVFKNGKFIGFVTAEEAAAKMQVGPATIYSWVTMGLLEGVVISGVLYIPANAKSPI